MPDQDWFNSNAPPTNNTDWFSQNQQVGSASSARTAPGIAAVIAAKTAPLVKAAAEEVATNPAVPRTTAAIGRVLGAAAPFVEGPTVGVLGAAKGSWLGGKTGWFTGKLLQNAAAPVATALEAAAPWLQAAGVVGGMGAGGQIDPTLDHLYALLKDPRIDKSPAAKKAIEASIKARGGSL